MGSDGGCLMVCGAEYAGEKKRKEGRKRGREREKSYKGGTLVCLQRSGTTEFVINSIAHIFSSASSTKVACPNRMAER